MSNFYKPQRLHIKNIPIILYPYKGIEGLLERNNRVVFENHMKELYEKNSELLKGQYHIVILWKDKEFVMTDVWVFGDFESWEAGPIIDVLNFKDYKKVNGSGVTAGDGIIMLGREEEKRREKQKIEEYLKGERPKLPKGINPEEDYFL
jgi:hypothetical protein